MGFLLARPLHKTRDGVQPEALTRPIEPTSRFHQDPICPSMLHETYAMRFLQAGGEQAGLQEQLGVVDPLEVETV